MKLFVVWFFVLCCFVPVGAFSAVVTEKEIAKELSGATTWRQVDFVFGYYGDKVTSGVVTTDFERRLNSGWENKEQLKILQTLLLSEKVKFSTGSWDIWLAGWYSTLCAAQNWKDTGHPVYEAKREFVKLCFVDNGCGLKYNMRGAFRHLFGVEAIKKKYEEFYVCLLSQLATTKMSSQEKIELLDYAIEEANKYENVVFANVGSVLKQEIKKAENGD